MLAAKKKVMKSMKTTMPALGTMKMPQRETLKETVASMMHLYQLAKGYHLHVTGPTFYGDHKTYDGIAELAIEWYDKLAEFMRGRELDVPYCPESLLEYSLIEFPDPKNARGMLESMLGNLDCVVCCLQESYGKGCPTTDSLLQELEVDLNKQIYFVKSSL